MLNIESMTVEQLKQHCSAKQLAKLDNHDLGQVLLATKGMLDYLSEAIGIDDIAERSYWTCVYQLLDQEFKSRNIQVNIITSLQAFWYLDETIETEGEAARKIAWGVIKKYSTEQLLAVLKELNEDYGVTSLPNIREVIEEVISGRNNVN